MVPVSQRQVTSRSHRDYQSQPPAQIRTHQLRSAASSDIFETMSVLLETSAGDITVDLFVEEAPKCCEKYVRSS
jgi:hypothetical protein